MYAFLAIKVDPILERSYLKKYLNFSVSCVVSLICSVFCLNCLLLIRLIIISIEGSREIKNTGDISVLLGRHNTLFYEK